MSIARKVPGRLKIAAIAAATAVIVAALPVSAQAQGTHMSLRQASDEGIAARPSRQDRTVDKRQQAVRAQEAYYGRAPYICTPSGFGRTASCFLRVRLGG